VVHARDTRVADPLFRSPLLFLASWFMLGARESLTRCFVLRRCTWREYEPVSCIHSYLVPPPEHPAEAREALGPDAARSRRRPPGSPPLCHPVASEQGPPTGELTRCASMSSAGVMRVMRYGRLLPGANWYRADQSLNSLRPQVFWQILYGVRRAWPCGG